MADITVDSIKIAAKPITIPEHIEYPDQRITVDSGEVVAARDRVVVRVHVEDKDGNVRGLLKRVVYKFTDMPIDPTVEILGAVSISFVESPKPVVE